MAQLRLAASYAPGMAAYMMHAIFFFTYAKVVARCRNFVYNGTGIRANRNGK